MEEEQHILIIDGDVLCHKAAEQPWAMRAKKRGYDIVSLDENGKRQERESTPEEDQAALAAGEKRLKSLIDQLMEELFATDYLFAVKSGEGFRDEIYPGYKGARKARGGGNKIVQILRDLSVIEGYGVPADWREADDLVRMWAEQCREHDIRYTIVSIDKDLLCIPGRHYVMATGGTVKGELVYMSEAEAMRHYYQQLLSGDQTDSVPGLPGIGPVKAAALVAHCQTEEEFQEIVVGSYIEYFGDDWWNQLLSNGKMIHIQRHPNDFFNLMSWPVARELA